MARQHTPSQTVRSIAGSALVGPGLFILFGNLDGAAAALRHLLATTSVSPADGCDPLFAASRSTAWVSPICQKQMRSCSGQPMKCAEAANPFRHTTALKFSTKLSGTGLTVGMRSRQFSKQWRRKMPLATYDWLSVGSNSGEPFRTQRREFIIALLAEIAGQPGEASSKYRALRIEAQKNADGKIVSAVDESLKRLGAAKPN